MDKPYRQKLVPTILGDSNKFVELLKTVTFKLITRPMMRVWAKIVYKF